MTAGEEERIRRKQQSLAAGKLDLRGELSGMLQIAALRGHAASTLRLMRDAQRIVLELAGVHNRIEASRSRLLEAARQRRA